ncbi:Utp21 specific WD40 associated putative domain-containing protein [Aspergillus cavernicola]|uniref:Utp21 specific WD40 associated putative domain-containing protein n=1 Tax=Aspergillus cavernicola TaxID=176166 RepID=A0ABR4J3B5_9EURO
MPSIDNYGFSLPLAKRQKIKSDNIVHEDQRKVGSRVFSPFRTLGLVSPTSVPFTCARLGKATFQITTSVGRCLHTYDLRQGLKLVFISRPQTPHDITATFAWQDKVFAAWGPPGAGISGGIWVFKRGKKVASLQVPIDSSEPIERLLVFGSWIVGCSGRSVTIWKNGSYEYYTSLTSSRPGDLPGQETYATQICNMPTYLNKVFVGKSDGNVEIWNVKTGTLIHNIIPSFPNSGPVTVLQPTPAISVIAIGYKNGAISIQNVETGQSLFSFQPEILQTQTITSIAFRNDGFGAGEEGRQSGAMATACVGSGDVMLWDLNRGGRVMGILRGAHKTSGDGSSYGINHIEFLDGQPVLVSTGKDNSLRTWIFDETPFSPVPRPLHSRRGHSDAITTVSFLPSSSDGSESTAKWLLSASKDCSLWGFSMRKDSQSTEVSQGAVDHRAKRKGEAPLAVGSCSSANQSSRAPEITCIACSLNRDGGMGVTTSGPIWANPKATDTTSSNKTGWESIVTGHHGDKFARTWFWGKKKAGRWAFETGDGMDVKSVAISQCGTFALVGSTGGSIRMFNMQSGQLRQSYPPPLAKNKFKLDGGASTQQSGIATEHTKAITGLAIDSLNRSIVSCGLDGKVKFWDFQSGVLIDELDWYPMTAITALRYNSTSELVAFSCDDLSIRIVDMETKKIVRELWGCAGQINDFTFSHDGRWVVAASMDSIIRVWDLPTGHLIDIFRVSSTCTSLAMSPTGDFLATAHADGVGIGLWSNKSLFVPVSARNLNVDGLYDATAPTSSGEGGVGIIEAAFAQNDEQGDSDGPVLPTEQISREMLTLSVVPKNKWQTLVHMDLIKERNMPKEAPKAPERAPFFLPAPSAQATSDDSANARLLADRTAVETSRVARVQLSKFSKTSSRFTALLEAGCFSGDFGSFFDEMKSMTPAKLDLEIRSLDPKAQGDQSELSVFVLALTNRLASRRDFELANAWMAVFLRIHSDVVASCSESTGGADDKLRNALDAWCQAQQTELQRLASLVGYCRGVVGFLRSSR